MSVIAGKDNSMAISLRRLKEMIIRKNRRYCLRFCFCKPPNAVCARNQEDLNIKLGNYFPVYTMLWQVIADSENLL